MNGDEEIDWSMVKIETVPIEESGLNQAAKLAIAAAAQKKAANVKRKRPVVVVSKDGTEKHVSPAEVIQGILSRAQIEISLDKPKADDARFCEACGGVYRIDKKAITRSKFCNGCRIEVPKARSKTPHYLKKKNEARKKRLSSDTGRARETQYRRDYRDRTEVKESRREYQKRRQSTPEGKAKKAEYQRSFYARKNALSGRPGIGDGRICKECGCTYTGVPSTCQTSKYCNPCRDRKKKEYKASYASSLRGRANKAALNAAYRARKVDRELAENAVKMPEDVIIDDGLALLAKLHAEEMTMTRDQLLEMNPPTMYRVYPVGMGY